MNSHAHFFVNEMTNKGNFKVFVDLYIADLPNKHDKSFVENTIIHEASGLYCDGQDKHKPYLFLHYYTENG